jgi:hypothetical protein
MLTLTACATSGSNTPVPPQVSLAAVPADMKACFSSMVPKPPKGEITRQQAYNIIAALKRSELVKSQCGKRLIAFYEAQQGPLK